MKTNEEILRAIWETLGLEPKEIKVPEEHLLTEEGAWFTAANCTTISTRLQDIIKQPSPNTDYLLDEQETKRTSQKILLDFFTKMVEEWLPERPDLMQSCILDKEGAFSSQHDKFITFLTVAGDYEPRLTLNLLTWFLLERRAFSLKDMQEEHLRKTNAAFLHDNLEPCWEEAEAQHEPKATLEKSRKAAWLKAAENLASQPRWWLVAYYFYSKRKDEPVTCLSELGKYSIRYQLGACSVQPCGSVNPGTATTHKPLGAWQAIAGLIAEYGWELPPEQQPQFLRELRSLQLSWQVLSEQLSTILKSAADDLKTFGANAEFLRPFVRQIQTMLWDRNADPHIIEETIAQAYQALPPIPSIVGLLQAQRSKQPTAETFLAFWNPSPPLDFAQLRSNEIKRRLRLLELLEISFHSLSKGEKIEPEKHPLLRRDHEVFSGELRVDFKPLLGAEHKAPVLTIPNTCYPYNDQKIQDFFEALWKNAPEHKSHLPPDYLATLPEDAKYNLTPVPTPMPREIGGDTAGAGSAASAADDTSPKP